MEKKMVYEAPLLEVMLLEAESAILASSGTPTGGTGSEGLDDSIWI